MIVADTNLIAYLLISGPKSAEAQAAFDRDGEWISPLVWHHELLNVLATSIRQGYMSKEEGHDVWAHAPAFVRDAEVPPLEVLDLAVNSNFATYDCNYVVLARSMAVRLVTADKKLLENFKDVAVSIEDFASGK